MNPKSHNLDKNSPKDYRVSNMFSRTQRIGGFLTEERFFNAIKNSNGSAPEWYRDIVKTEAKLDRKGIDFIIYTSYGNIYVQTKSSDSGAKKFLKQLKIKRSKNKIIVLVIKIEYGEEEIRDISFSAIEKEIELFRKPFCQ